MVSERRTMATTSRTMMAHMLSVPSRTPSMKVTWISVAQKSLEAARAGTPPVRAAFMTGTKLES